MTHALSAGCRFVATRGGAFLALVLPIVFNPYARAPFEPTKVTVFRWTVGAMVIAFLLHKVLTRERPAGLVASPPRKSETLLVVSVLAYGAVQVLATIVSVDPHQSFWGFGPSRHGTLTTLTLLAFFFIARWSLGAEGERETLRTAMIVGSVPVTLYGMVQLLGLDPLSWTTDSVSHVHSTMGRSNFLGAYLAMIIPFVIARIVRPSSERSSALLFLIALALLQVTTLLATQARGAWLGLTAAVVVFSAALAWRWRRGTYLWLCAAALVLGIGLLPVLNRVDLLRTAGLSSPQRESGQTFVAMRAHTVESRFRIWEAVLCLVPDRWLIGFGPETFPTVFAERYPTFAFPASGNVRLTDPHNVLLSHLFATGVLGLAAFVALVGAFFVVGVDRMRSADTDDRAASVAAELAAMAAYLIHSQFNPDVIVLSVFFWVLMDMGALGARSPAAGTPKHPGS